MIGAYQIHRSRSNAGAVTTTQMIAAKLFWPPDVAVRSSRAKLSVEVDDRLVPGLARVDHDVGRLRVCRDALTDALTDAGLSTAWERTRAQGLHLLIDSTGLKMMDEGERKRKKHGTEY